MIRKTFNRACRHLTPFKSQKRQDWWVIQSVYAFKRGGFFVDLAAADGITHNNTYALEKLFGWKGICIEPNPEFVARLRRCRRCPVADVVVSGSDESVEFRIDNGQLGGIVDEDTDNNPTTRGDELSEATIICREAVTLQSILDRFEAPSHIDYLSLDVEGSEERVLTGFDFERYRFGCLTIERPTPRVNEILFEHDYVFVKNVQYDSFYVHASSAEARKLKCDDFEQVPSKDW